MADDVVNVKNLTSGDYARVKDQTIKSLLRYSPRYAEPTGTMPLPPHPDGTPTTTVRGLSHEAYLRAKRDALKALRTPKA